MTAALAQIEKKYGAEAASDMEQVMRQAINEELLPQLRKLQQFVATALAAFKASEMIPATELQKKSFRALRAQLTDHPRLMLLYKSAPSAVLFDAQTLERVEEEVSATIAAFHWQAHEGEDVSAENFWSALRDVRPSPEGR